MDSENKPSGGFKWSDLGDIATGRPGLGNNTSVAAYRLMQYPLRAELIRRFGRKIAGEILYAAGKSAGTAFAEHFLERTASFSHFLSTLQQRLKEEKIGILRVENTNMDTLSLEISVYEDLDCSGLPLLGDTVCDFDEGFLAGVLEFYTGTPMSAKEIDCWATGARVCRFLINKKEE